MALYTKKGDKGTTTLYACDQRISKSSNIAEALGVMDEANSYLALCKVQARVDNFVLNDKNVADIIHEMQDDMFIIQAELAGADKTIKEEKLKWMESIIDEIEKELPQITSFRIPGGTELAARLDFARTLVRRAERRLVAVHEEGIQKIGEWSLAYMNRMSSLLYALARFANEQRDIKEDAPDYK